MAIYFDRGNYLRTTSPPVTAVPCTISAWFNADDITNYHQIADLRQNGGSDERMTLTADGTRGSPLDPLGVEHKGPTSNITARSVAAYAASTWQHAGGVFSSISARSTWLNGVETVGPTTNVGAATIDHAHVGGAANSIIGAVAEVAYWNVDLTDAEMGILAEGWSPWFVRPQNLVAYLPCYSTADKGLEVISGTVWTETGTLTDFATHPPMIEPELQQIFLPSVSGFQVAWARPQSGIIGQGFR